MISRFHSKKLKIVFFFVCICVVYVYSAEIKEILVTKNNGLTDADRPYSDSVTCCRLENKTDPILSGDSDDDDLDTRSFETNIIQAAQIGDLETIINYSFDHKLVIDDSLAGKIVHTASQNRHIHIIRHLIENNQIEIDSIYAGRALLESSKNSEVEFVELLLNISNTFFVGKALRNAIVRDDAPIINVLLKRISDLSKSSIRNSVISAFSNKNIETVSVLLSKVQNFNDQEFGRTLRDAVEEGHLELIRLLLDTRKNIDNLYIGQALCEAATQNHSNIIEYLLDSREDLDKAFIRQALCEASNEGHLDPIPLLLEVCSDNISVGQAFCVSSKVGHTDVVKFFVNSGLSIDSFYFHQALIEASLGKKFETFNFLFENCEKYNDSYTIYTLLEASKKIDFPFDCIHSDAPGVTRTGVCNEDLNCRFIALISALTGLGQFREVLFASLLEDGHHHTISAILAAVLAKMQLADSKFISIDNTLIPQIRREPHFYESYWLCITSLGNFLFNLLPEKVKNVFQVHLQFSKTTGDKTCKLKLAFKNFIIISPRYFSVTDAIKANFNNDVSRNAYDEINMLAENEGSDFDRIELLYLPEILIFAINRQGPTPDSQYFNNSFMKLDYELEVALSPDIKAEKYTLQAFIYRNEGHFMSFVRDQSNWYMHDDDEVTQSTTQKHFDSLIKKANTTCTFAFYVRSDVSCQSGDPKIPDRVLELVQSIFG